MFSLLVFCNHSFFIHCGQVFFLFIHKIHNIFPDLIDILVNRQCDSSNLNLAPLCELSDDNILMNKIWGDAVKRTYGEKPPKYVARIPGTRRSFYVSKSREDKELIQALTKVLISFRTDQYCYVFRSDLKATMLLREILH